MRILTKRSLSIFLSAAFACSAMYLSALDIKLPELSSIIPFGTPFSSNAKWGYVPRIEATMEPLSGNASYPASGALIYRQQEAPLKTVFGFPLGEAEAVFNMDGFITIMSGIGKGGHDPASGAISAGTIAGTAGGSGIYQQGILGLRIFDMKKASWINPFFFAGGIMDQIPPVIEGITLIEETKSGSKGKVYPIQLRPAQLRPGQKGSASECPQGHYLVHIQAWDIINREMPHRAAPFRFVVRLNGTSAVDVSMISAQYSEKGIMFLGNEAPSSNALAEGGMWMVGRISLPRGVHELEVELSDFQGNKTLVRTAIVAY
jgi:hypothetical protein